MKILSVNVSPPLEIAYRKKIIRTGIFKKPVVGKIYASQYNLDGDGQADLKNHGGLDKAVYAYSYDHYKYWKQVLDRNDFEYGQFGENLTVTGLDESGLYIGDELQAGTVRFVVTQPRVPCFKLGVRFNDSRMPKRFLQSALTGCYLRVLQEGYLQAGDELALVKREPIRLSVKDLFKALYHPRTETTTQILAQALQITYLSRAWRTQIEERLSESERKDSGQ